MTMQPSGAAVPIDPWRASARRRRGRRRLGAMWAAGSSAMCLLACGGCTPLEYGIGGAAAATVVGGQAPTHEIQQVYYLGVFDPLEQTPPSVYRITVRGQGSFLSQTRFASGWAPAAFIDSLTSTVDYNQQTGALGAATADRGQDETLSLGRRMVMFGPDGFLEAPAAHRLVLVMGSDPSKFFDAVNAGILEIAGLERAKDASGARDALMSEHLRMQSQRDRLRDLLEDVSEDRS